MNPEKHIKLKAALAVAAFTMSIIFAMLAFWCPPMAVIDQSILWFIAQLLCFSATLLGFSMTIDNVRQIASGKPNEREDANS